METKATVKERVDIDAALDGAMFTTEDESEFLNFIKKIEVRSKWVSVPVRTISVSTDTDSVTGITGKAKSETVYVIFTDGGTRPVGKGANPSILERARISGAALGCVSNKDFAFIITKCLHTSKETEETLLRIQEGKVRAFCASTYKIIPQPEIYQTAKEEIDRLFGGSFVRGTWSHDFRETLNKAPYTEQKTK